MTDVRQDTISDLEAGVIGHYNPVKVSDTVGVMILGVLVLLLLIALLRSHGRNRALLGQIAESAQVQDSAGS
jgi:hypothetical protein